MEYKNARDILPTELVKVLQNYVQGTYLYIPKRVEDYIKSHHRTDYKVELEKRNYHIYLKHLEGWSDEKLAIFYNLSRSSIRRIVLYHKRKVENMTKEIESVLSVWGLEGKRIVQRYHSVWEIGNGYMLKVYSDKNQLDRNIKMLTILHDFNIPVAEIICTRSGEKYTVSEKHYYMLTGKLKGNNISDIRNFGLAYSMGDAIGQLHIAFQKCEDKLSVEDNSLLVEMNGWVREVLFKDNWQIIKEDEYINTVNGLQSVYEKLPKQLIHRGVHFGNFLFYENEFSGYIDFDLSQRNIRIFDICYFLAGLLTEESGADLKCGEWLRILKEVVSGYENRTSLSTIEKQAFPCVMKSIEILCVAYFITIEDVRCANDAANVFRYIQMHENEIRRKISD